MQKLVFKNNVPDLTLHNFQILTNELDLVIDFQISDRHLTRRLFLGLDLNPILIGDKSFFGNFKEIWGFFKERISGTITRVGFLPRELFITEFLQFVKGFPINDSFFDFGIRNVNVQGFKILVQDGIPSTLQFFFPLHKFLYSSSVSFGRFVMWMRAKLLNVWYWIRSGWASLWFMY